VEETTAPFTPETPPLAAEVVAELERLRSEGERALAAEEFERAAELRDRERKLSSVRARQPVGLPPREHYERFWHSQGLSLVPGWLLFGVSLGIGVLIGWAIWGL
jgi:hypothetical protein